MTKRAANELSHLAPVHVVQPGVCDVLLGLLPHEGAVPVEGAVLLLILQVERGDGDLAVPVAVGMSRKKVTILVTERFK